MIRSLLPVVVLGLSVATHERAMELASGGDFFGALPLFLETALRDPTSFNWNNVGVTQLRMGDDYGAGESFQKALAANSNDSTVLRNMRAWTDLFCTHRNRAGIRHYHFLQFPQARENFMHAIFLKPSDTRTLDNIKLLGQRLKQLGIGTIEISAARANKFSPEIARKVAETITIPLFLATAETTPRSSHLYSSNWNKVGLAQLGALQVREARTSFMNAIFSDVRDLGVVDNIAKLSSRMKQAHVTFAHSMPQLNAALSSSQKQVLGAYYSSYKSPSQVVRVIRSFRSYYPSSPLVLANDGGDDFRFFAASVGAELHQYSRIMDGASQTIFLSAAHALEYLHRSWRAFAYLAERGATHALLLEDDVRVLRKYTGLFNFTINGFDGYGGSLPESSVRPSLSQYGISHDQTPKLLLGGLGGSVLHISYLLNHVPWDALGPAIAILEENGHALWNSDVLFSFLAYAFGGSVGDLPETMTLGAPEHRSRETSSIAVLHGYKAEYGESPTEEEMEILGLQS
jgi:tetratricopeptide (TPR) repeat protein